MAYIRSLFAALCLTLASLGAVQAAETTRAGNGPLEAAIAASVEHAMQQKHLVPMGTCITVSTPFVVSYASGSISIAYQLCPISPDFSSFTWNGTITYNNVNWGSGYSINGNVSLVLTYASNSINSIEFTGGPLNYTIGGHPYTVDFNNLTFNFNNTFTVVSATGSLTINGQTVTGNGVYWAYLFH